MAPPPTRSCWARRRCHQAHGSAGMGRWWAHRAISPTARAGSWSPHITGASESLFAGLSQEDKSFWWMVIKHHSEVFSPLFIVLGFVIHADRCICYMCTVLKIIKWTPCKRKNIAIFPQNSVFPFLYTIPFCLGRDSHCSEVHENYFFASKKI